MSSLIIPEYKIKRKINKKGVLMKDKILHNESAKENKPISPSQNIVISRKTTILMLLVVIALTAVITYYVAISTQTPKVINIKEGWPISKSGGEVKLTIKPVEKKSVEGIVTLNKLS